jgi:hypothetical protein
VRTARKKKAVCVCGDFKSHHDDRGCMICRNSRAPWDNCTGFRHSHYEASAIANDTKKQ